MLPAQCIMQLSCSCFAKLFQSILNTESDASDTVVGSVLTQDHAFSHKTIALLSNTLTSCEKNYSVYDHKMLAIISYCKAWQGYIVRQRAVVMADYKLFIHLYTYFLLSIRQI